MKAIYKISEITAMENTLKELAASIEELTGDTTEIPNLLEEFKKTKGTKSTKVNVLDMSVEIEVETELILDYFNCISKAFRLVTPIIVAISATKDLIIGEFGAVATKWQ